MPARFLTLPPMPGPPAPVVCFIALCAAALGGNVAAQSLVPEKGLLVLKNGYVIEGDVTRAGDDFLVTRGEGAELSVKADEVECFCATLIEAYEFKARRVSGASSRPHLELAKWCLRHNLLAQCREELKAVEKAEPGLPQTKELLSRLTFLEAEPAPAPPASGASITPVETIEKAVAQLPRGSLERFSAVVQPILLNRCAANQCHGPNSKSEFRLLRPPAGQMVSRRFTQRNLYVTLRQLDSANPDQSPLVLKAEQRHGSALAPIFDQRSAGQLNELVAWARMAVGAPAAPVSSRAEMAAPAVPATQPSIPSSVAGMEVLAKTSGHSQSSGAIGTGTIQGTEEAGTRAPTSTGSSARQAAVERDRFDPEIFNRRYHRR